MCYVSNEGMFRDRYGLRYSMGLKQALDDPQADIRVLSLNTPFTEGGESAGARAEGTTIGQAHPSMLLP